MARSKGATRVEGRSIGYGWLVLLAVIAGFGLSLWVRYMATPKLTALERVIAANAPLDHVHTALVRPDGTLLVGTHLGVLQGKGSQWTRLPGLEADIMTMALSGDGTLYVAGDGLGVARYQAGGQTLLRGAVQALAVDPKDPDRLLAYGRELGLQESRDAGRSWVQAGTLNGQPIFALAISPVDGMLYAGGVQGTLYASPDGGRSWNVAGAPGGSITHLGTDPAKAGRLWAAAGGAAIYTDDGGVTWTRLRGKAAAKPWVALAPASSGGGGLWGVTADGYLATLTD